MNPLYIIWNCASICLSNCLVCGLYLLLLYGTIAANPRLLSIGKSYVAATNAALIIVLALHFFSWSEPATTLVIEAINCGAFCPNTSVNFFFTVSCDINPLSCDTTLIFSFFCSTGNFSDILIILHNCLFKRFPTHF